MSALLVWGAGNEDWQMETESHTVHPGTGSIQPGFMPPRQEVTLNETWKGMHWLNEGMGEGRRGWKDESRNNQREGCRRCLDKGMEGRMG